MEKQQTWQIKCHNCGHVRNEKGSFTESFKICPRCQEVIMENGIAEIKQEYLLE